MLLLIMFVFYFMPTIVAGVRGMPNVWQVFTLNLFLGWTFFCWVLALVWAVGPRYEGVQR